MPLEILLPLVVLGIAGLGLALHLLGFSTPLRLTCEAHVRAAWLREHPEDAPQTILLTQDGRAALLRLASGHLGLLRALGADTVAQYLGRATWQITANGIKLTLPDFATQPLNIRLTEAERQDWLALKDHL
ncbi:hypothetical protein [uncultured Lentibacter sp.]|jgi:hypothetical protein|uniref:hypothetical protein n=1 Tax=uncultured Lentibacter sp. TaxID=1659309 RepID=UPI0026211BB5|nr:hypothetical protein [uncultured Lentibacter sp.]